MISNFERSRMFFEQRLLYKARKRAQTRVLTAPLQNSSFCSVVCRKRSKANIKYCQSFSEVYHRVGVELTLTSSKDWPVCDCSILIPPKSLLLLQISYWGVIQLVCCALLQIRGKHQHVRCTKNTYTHLKN